MNENKRRHPLQKDRFLEGNRQKFTLILIVCMFLVMYAEVQFHIISAPYLSFLTFVGSMFIGGASLTAWVQANRSETLNNNVIQKTDITETKNENVKIEEDLKQYIKEEGQNAPDAKPFGTIAIGGEEALNDFNYDN